MYVRADISLFRNLTTLGQKAGVQRKHLGKLVMKELTDNALDAGANVKVGKSGEWYFVEDDGPGIDGDDEEIASLFSFGRPLTSSKLLRLPTRGALGNGLRVVAGAVCGSGGGLRVRTFGRWLKLSPQDDGSTHVERLDSKGAPSTGTRVEVKLGGDLVDDNLLTWANIAVALRGDSSYKGKSSPWWYGDEDFFELLQAHHGDLGTLLRQLEIPAMAVKELDVDGAKTQSFTRVHAAKLLTGLREVSKEVKASRLGLVGGALNVSDGYAKDTGEFKLPSNGDNDAKLPFVVEVSATKLEKDGDPSIMFFVNRTPVPGENSEVYILKAETHVHGCGLAYKVKTGRAPMKYVVNIQTPYMPITTDGKEPNLEPLAQPIMQSIKKAARRAQRATRGDREERTSKKDIIINVIPEAINKASGHGAHRFSLRQLFYAVRPLFQEDSGEDELDYNHFASVVTGYEQELGHDIPKMYRDARGTLYHPHTGETIPLGTLNVEAYKRPEWTFNKILYCEKEGFFPLLLDEKWAERHDCALLSSKGFASRAARDVIDLLGESDEELLFFAIHDADGPGTKILESLQEATRARPARKVRIIDLGLNPWEAVEMRLESERVERKGGGRVPVAQYVRDYKGDSRDWEDWLQRKRVELNAMSSPDFLAWLDRKMEEHDQGKVVPPEKVLAQKFDEAVSKEVRERVTAKILEENNAEQRIGETIKKATKKSPLAIELERRVRKSLDKKPAELWSAPLGREAADLAEKTVNAEKQS